LSQLPLALRSRLRQERGIALISAVGILAVLSGLGGTLIMYSSANYRSAEVSSHRVIGGHVAEAGIAQAMSVLAKSTNAARPDALPPGAATIDGETVSWSGVLEGDMWTITSTSRVKNPTGAGDLIRTVKSKARVMLDTRTSGGGAWNYVYADDVTTCTTLPNNVTIETPFFVKGNLCMRNTAKITGAPLKVGGTVTIDNAASIGTAGARIAEAHIGGGCKGPGQSVYTSPCGDAQSVYVASPGADTNVGTITKPPVDLARWYSESRPGPLGNCTQGSFPGGFDNNTVMDRSLPAPVNLMPAAAYDCVFKSGANTLGRIAWTGGSSGTLTIMGTIFFDGDIILSNNAAGVYQGRGVIYTSGRIELSNWTSLCAAAGCNEDQWDPNANLIVFVAGSSTDANGFYIHNNAKLQGAVYTVNDFREENSSTMQGPVVARQLYFENYAASVKWVPIWAYVTGTPSDATSTTVVQVESSWAG